MTPKERIDSEALKNNLKPCKCGSLPAFNGESCWCWNENCSLRGKVMSSTDWQNQIRFPWQEGILAGWDIVGMNHYHKDHERWLFVAMTYGPFCIRAESPDEIELFKVLALEAEVIMKSDISKFQE
jgi:hypothetical protein